MASEERFGYEWDNYSGMAEIYERQFLNWTSPLGREYWRGKRFMDAGCGMGRNSYWPMQWGADSCVAFDNDERSLARARETLKEFPAAHVVRKSIYDIDWKDEFDVAFSIGVIHHLERPEEALRNMVASLKPGGKLIIWVYGHEGFEWMRFVDPVRIYITSKLPLPVVHFLSYFCSIPLYIFVKVYRGQNGYFKHLSHYTFWHIHMTVFDQLIPTVAHYWRKDEVEALVQGLPLQDITIYHPFESSGWVLIGDKKTG